jgi:arylsulfatase A
MNRILLHAAVLLISATLSDGSAAERPNVVVLLSDDLGYQDIGCYGGPVKTPTLDKLADKGTRFTDFYSGCAVCSPSRATLLTGRHHIRTGVYSWIFDPSQRSHLLEREITLAEILKDAGYATAHIGKWHLGLPTNERAKPTPKSHGTRRTSSATAGLSERSRTIPARSS